MKTRVLVTGACGFIGHHLVDLLKKLDYEVHGVDNMENGDPVWIDQLDAYYDDHIQNFQIPQRVEYVFHLAALPRAPYSVEYPTETNDSNVTGTLELLDEARRSTSVRKFIFSSSSSVYGIQDKLPISEDAPTQPMTPYGLQKLIGEQYCELFYQLYGLRYVALRYFNVYGEHQDGDHPYATAVSKFLEQRNQGKYLTIQGTGAKTRDMTYVKDVCLANVQAMETDAHGIFNIGSGEQYKIKDIADMISTKQVHVENRPNEAEHTKADITKAKAELGWGPQTDLETWIKNR